MALKATIGANGTVWIEHNISIKKSRLKQQEFGIICIENMTASASRRLEIGNKTGKKYYYLSITLPHC